MAAAKKLDRLTAEQEALLWEFHAEWLHLGMSTEPADRPRAEAAVTDMYAAIGEKLPAFLWCDSPATAMLAIHVLREITNPKSSLESSLGSSLESSLRSSLWSSLRSSLGSSLWSSLWSSLESSLWSSLGSCYWGQQEAWWQAFYRFPEQHLGVKYDAERSRQLRLWEDLSRSCGWWWPYRGLAVMTERPVALHMEPVSPGARELRLHCETGPALLYRDGWAVHAVHGVRVPAQVVESPKTLTVAQIRDETNAEVRRVMLERFGAEDYMRLSGATKVGTDDWGTLWRAPLPGDEDLVMVEVLNSTAEPDGTFKTYWLRVPPATKSAREAVAWTFGETAEDYAAGLVAQS